MGEVQEARPEMGEALYYRIFRAMALRVERFVKAQMLIQIKKAEPKEARRLKKILGNYKLVVPADPFRMKKKLDKITFL